MTRTLGHSDLRLSERFGYPSLIAHVKRRLGRVNNGLIVICVGATGTGKSWGAMKLASDIDRTFTESRVFFEASPFLDWLMSPDAKPGRAAILDEAGLVVAARDWQSNMNRSLALFAQSVRYRGLLIIVTVPSLSFIDSNVRASAHVLVSFDRLPTRSKRGKPGRAHAHIRKLRLDTRTGELYLRHIPGRAVGTRYRMAFKAWTAKFDAPARKLTRAYEASRADYMKSKHDEIRRAVKGEKSEGDESDEERAQRLLWEEHERTGDSWDAIAKRHNIPTSTAHHWGQKHERKVVIKNIIGDSDRGKA